MLSICISPMVRDVEHLFLSLLDFCITWKQRLFTSSDHFLIRLLSYTELCEFLYIFNIKPLSNILFANIFSYSLGRLSVLLMIFFSMQKILVWCYLICLSLLLFCLPEETNQCVIKGCDACSIVLDLKVALAIRDLLCFHTNFRIIHPSSVKNAIGIILTL